LPIVLALIGGMGAGKTTLFRAMGTCLDCDPLPTSPTYALIQEYRTADGKVVIHADLDRLRGPEEWLDLDPEHLLDRADWVWLEWPERAGPYLPASTFFISWKRWFRQRLFGVLAWILLKSPISDA
jgi:tRNA threonylcarbamoyl adenosine modification protein YjeE